MDSSKNGNTGETLEIQGMTKFAQVPRWILRAGKDISPGARATYGVIMSYADNGDRAAFPGQKRIAENLGVSDRTVRTWISELEKFGALKVTRRRYPDSGNFRPNHYVLMFADPRAAALSIVPGDTHGKQASSGGRKQSSAYLDPASTTPSLHSPTESASPRGDDDSSLRSHRAPRDARWRSLRDEVRAILDAQGAEHEDQACEAFAVAYEAVYGAGEQDALNLLANGGFIDRLHATLREGIDAGKRDPIQWVVPTFIARFHAATHGTAI